MRKLPFVILLITVATASADPWLTEDWRCNLNGTPKDLGPVWMEDDRMKVAIGLAGTISIVENGRIVVELDSLDGDITALNRIDFGDDRGTQLIAYAISYEMREAWWELRLHQFSGPGFNRHSSEFAGLFGSMNMSESFMPMFIGNNILPGGDGSALSLPVGIRGSCQNSFGSFGDAANFGYFYGFGSEVLNTCGSPRWIEQIDVEGDEAPEFVVLSDSSYYEYTDAGPYFELARSSVELTVISNEGENLRSRVLAHDSSLDENMDASYSCVAFGGCYYREDASYLIVAHRDSAACYIEKCWLPDLETDRCSEWNLNEQAEMWVVPDEEIDVLVAFTHSGELYQFNVTDWEEIGVTQMPDSQVIETRLGDFDGDGRLEVLQLTPSQQVCYTLHSLAVGESPSLLVPSAPQVVAFPNPFNRSTTISYTLPKAGWTTMEIVDVSGRLVERLSGGWKAAGEYREIWEADGIAGGVYQLNLMADKESVTKSLMQIK
jgi:hypothetical protein